MKKISILFCLAFALYASDTLGIGEKKEEEKRVVYAVQLFAEQNLDLAKTTLQRIKKEIRDDTTLHKIGNYIVGRYGKNESRAEVEFTLQTIRQAGYKDSYIITSTDVDMKNNLVYNQNNNVTQSGNTHAASKNGKETPNKIPQKEKKGTSKLSDSDRSTALLKAESAYEKGNENEAMIYYEMLLASGETSQKVKNNLCYLYGKRGAWLQAKEIIEGEIYSSKLIYAYAYGAVESNQDSYYSDLSEYIMVDKSGRLMLLSGYYFEKKEDMLRADSFYKMAYDKNPSDIYNTFAYARILDAKHNKEALLLYKNVLSKIDASHQLYEIVNKRLKELEDKNG